jgi:hypothetical protein
MMRRLGWVLVGFVATVCASQSAMSLEEAKKVSASFSGTTLVAPPRRVDDTLELLDKQKPLDQAANELGRAQQEMDDLARAEQIARFGNVPFAVANILYELAMAESTSGFGARAMEHERASIRLSGDSQREFGLKLASYGSLARGAAGMGDVDTVERETANARTLYLEGVRRFPTARDRRNWDASVAGAQAALAAMKG